MKTKMLLIALILPLLVVGSLALSGCEEPSDFNDQQLPEQQEYEPMDDGFDQGPVEEMPQDEFPGLDDF